MPLKVEKQERENVQSLIRRFTRAIKKSGILKQARKNRFRKRPLSDRSKKEAALRKEEVRRDYEKRDKLGLIKNKYDR